MNIDTEIDQITLSLDTNSYRNLTNKPSINSIELNGNKSTADLGLPTKTSDLTNDSGFINNTYHDNTKQDKLTAGTNITIENNVISATGGGASDYTQLTNKPTINNTELNGNKTTSDLNLSYNDLLNKPTIPTKTSELTNDSNFTTQTQLDSKLDKVSDVTYTNRVYSVNGQGVQTITIATHENGNTYWSLPLRDYPNKNFEVGNVVNDYHCANKLYVDTADALKLDKVTTTSTFPRLYGVSQAGEQITLNYSANNIASSIPIRRSDGTIRAGNPINDSDLTTKLYVDIRVPAWTSEDEGKILKIVNNTPTWVSE